MSKTKVRSADMVRKYQLAIQEVIDHCKRNSGKFAGEAQRDVSKKHHISNSFTTAIVRSGIAIRTGKGTLKFNISTCDPIHARQVIEEIDQLWKDHLERKKSGKNLRVKSKRKTSKRHAIAEVNQVDNAKKEKQSPVVSITNQKLSSDPCSHLNEEKTNSTRKTKKKTEKTKKVSILWGLFSWEKSV